ncbi:hypothetical protein VTK26DRAFT_3552 [Humicola hyalothermophila]
MVRWCSWLSRQSNTLKVSSSNLDRINRSCLPNGRHLGGGFFFSSLSFFAVDVSYEVSDTCAPLKFPRSRGQLNELLQCGHGGLIGPLLNIVCCARQFTINGDCIAAGIIRSLAFS